MEYDVDGPPGDDRLAGAASRWFAKRRPSAVSNERFFAAAQNHMARGTTPVDEQRVITSVGNDEIRRGYLPTIPGQLRVNSVTSRTVLWKSSRRISA